MSDYFATRQKVTAGIEWRGEVSFDYEGETYTWKARQLTDPEFFEILGQLNRDKLEELQDDVDESKMERYRELLDVDDLTEDEKAELERLKQEINEEENFLDKIDDDTFEALRQCAKYACEPDKEDIDYAWSNRHELFDLGENEAVTKSSIQKKLKEDMKETIDDMQNFTSLELGLRCLELNMESEGK